MLRNFADFRHTVPFDFGTRQHVRTRFGTEPDSGPARNPAQNPAHRIRPAAKIHKDFA